MALPTHGHLAALLAVACAQIADAQTPLYQSKTIVTGQEEPQRLIGFVRCFEQVLVKVSGDPRVATRSRDSPISPPTRPSMSWISVTATAWRAFRFTTSRGRGSGRMTSPSTSIRRRSTRSLAMLGSKPWLAERPRLVIFATVTNARGSYVLTRDGERGRDMREGLAAAAERLGMETILPDESILESIRPYARKLAGGRRRRRWTKSPPRRAA